MGRLSLSACSLSMIIKCFFVILNNLSLAILITIFLYTKVCIWKHKIHKIGLYGTKHLFVHILVASFTKFAMPSCGFYITHRGRQWAGRDSYLERKGNYVGKCKKCIFLIFSRGHTTLHAGARAPWAPPLATPLIWTQARYQWNTFLKIY